MKPCPTCSAPADTGAYALPVAPRSSLIPCLSSPARICQGTHEGTHVGALAHAVDFAAWQNTPVLCARSGVVVEVAGHFTRGGLDDALRHKANFVCIRHHDSYSRYFHLKSVCVRVGQTCAVGDELGRSGNTGYSTGPHLHFDVVDMNPTHVFELELCPGDAAVRCVPFSFSSRRVPEPGVAFPMVFAQPLDLSRNVSGPAGCALVCERGGEPSFREKATRADAALAALLIVVDNDDAMLDVLPPLVGDQRPEAVTECWAVFVAKTHWPALQQASAVSIRLISGVSPLVLTRRTDCFTPQSLPVNFTY